MDVGQVHSLLPDLYAASDASADADVEVSDSCGYGVYTTHDVHDLIEEGTVRSFVRVWTRTRDMHTGGTRAHTRIHISRLRG